MKGKKVHHNQKYDWDKWLKPRKSPLVLTYGVDFKCLPHGLVNQFRNHIRLHGIKGKFSFSVGKDSITVTRSK